MNIANHQAVIFLNGRKAFIQINLRLSSIILLMIIPLCLREGLEQQSRRCRLSINIIRSPNDEVISDIILSLIRLEISTREEHDEHEWYEHKPLGIIRRAYEFP